MEEVIVYESISAGFSAPAEEQSRQNLRLDQYIYEHPKSSVFLRVHGESMLGAGIYPGDIVVVDKSRSFVSGDIVVAQIDGLYTIKYIFRDTQKNIYLEAADPARSKKYPGEELQIFGVVVSLIRKY